VILNNSISQDKKDPPRAGLFFWIYKEPDIAAELLIDGEALFASVFLMVTLLHVLVPLLNGWAGDPSDVARVSAMTGEDTPRQFLKVSLVVDVISPH
jgi:hypothetical protein